MDSGIAASDFGVKSGYSGSKNSLWMVGRLLWWLCAGLDLLYLRRDDGIGEDVNGLSKSVGFFEVELGMIVVI